MKPGPRSFRLCLYLKRVVSNQTAFPSTVHSQRERGREREREEEREKLFDFDMAMHCFSWGPYIREEGESSFLGVE